MKKWKPFCAFLSLVAILTINCPTSHALASDLDSASDLIERVKDFHNQARYEEALAPAEQALALHERLVGPEAPETATSLYYLARVHAALGNHDQAAGLYERCLTIREKKLGPDDPAVSQALNGLALVYQELGKYDEAVGLLARALKIDVDQYGAHPNTAATINNLGRVYEAMGAYDYAEKLFNEALAIYGAKLGPEHPHTAVTLANLAGVYLDRGRYAEAAALYERVLTIDEKYFGPDHPSVAASLSGLGQVYKLTAEYGKAERLFVRALDIYRNKLGARHPHTALAASNLGILYDIMGLHEAAEPLLEEALAIREEILGPQSPLTATSQADLAYHYYLVGAYDRSEPLYLKSLAVREELLGPDHPDTSAGLNDLGTLYFAMGVFDRAETYYLRSLAIDEKVSGPESQMVASSLHNLAALYVRTRAFDKAEPMLKRSLAITEKILGSDHPDTASGLQNLAMFHDSRREYDLAEPLYRRALEIRENTLGPDHPSTAVSLNNLAILYYYTGEFERAEPLYTRALAIREKTLGPLHPEVALNYNNLGALYAAMEDYPKAHGAFKKAQEIISVTIDRILGFTDEQRQLQYLTVQQLTLEGAVGLAAFYLADDPSARKDALDYWLKRKGVILEAQKRFQEALLYGGDPMAMTTFRELAGVRSAMSRLTFGLSGGDPETTRRRLDELQREEERLEAELARMSSDYATDRKRKKADSEQIAAVLPPGSLLLEFVQIRPIDFVNQELWPARYLAFILRSGAGMDVRLVDLGQAEPIDRAIAEFKKALANAEDPRGEEAARLGREIYDLVFAPIAEDLGDSRKIFVSPDGNLNLIPFEVLQGPDGQYLIEDFTFDYLSSGRDLLGFDAGGARAGKSLVMGAPDFDLDGKSKGEVARSLGLNPEEDPGAAQRSGDMRGIRFDALPGALDEIEKIESLFGADQVDLYSGASAMEEVLKGLENPPRILHLATHGFFLTDRQFDRLTRHRILAAEFESETISERIENPLLRSGLALSGANRAFETGDKEGGDGLLTAEEVLGLRLKGTELVVLSACNTGLGEVRTGEGVYGLRRAFTRAGSDALVMSMWPVPDVETGELMVQFYRNILAGDMNRCQALRQAALSQMAVVKDRYGHTNPALWGAFVFLGDPGQAGSENGF